MNRSYCPPSTEKKFASLHISHNTGYKSIFYDFPWGLFGKNSLTLFDMVLHQPIIFYIILYYILIIYYIGISLPYSHKIGFTFHRIMEMPHFFSEYT